MSSRDHHASSSSASRKRDRSPEDRGSSKHSRRSDRDSGKSSRRDDDRRKDKDNSRRKDKSRKGHRSSKRSDSEGSADSGSASGSDTGSGTDSESEEDELIKKAKSMIQTISEDDYFTKSAEFRLWLKQAKKKYFEDMSADDTRRYFRKFVRAWNNFALDESYYKGIRSAQLSSKGTTKYQWGFAKKIAQEDKDRVESVRDSIDTMTNVKFANEVSRLTGKSTAGALESGLGPNSAPRRALGPSFPPPSEAQRLSRRPMTADDVAEKEEQDSRSRLHHRAEMRSYRKSKEADLEELVPKATGREAVLEKRRAQTAYNRRERSPDVELPEQDLMGTGDDYKSLLAAEKRRKEMREGKRYGGQSSGDTGPAPSMPVGPSRGPAVGSVLDAKKEAYKEKEQKQLEAFRQLWAQSQAAKGL
ncbi:hypothetical protein BGZ70_008143 [Mortierella alpina]|uniref:Uncharacterized protein n=1 Tax=Mortierella alpina TaxID=64518 RepID=A0A9P6M255_MORAP|nr:hypothetical protein BGZ70_008143 [Mortierella alpina]